MWVKIDDRFAGHPKIFEAGRLVGPPHGNARVLAVWLEALCWSNAYHTEGALPAAVVARLRHDTEPLLVAAALAAAGLWDQTATGWSIHNYPKYQLRVDARADKADAGRRGAASRWNGKTESLEKNGETWQNPVQSDGTCHDNAMANVIVLPSQNDGKPMARARAFPDPDPEDLKDPPRTPPPEGGASLQALRAGRRKRPRPGEGSTCPHEPSCASITVCVQRALADGQAERAKGKGA